MYKIDGEHLFQQNALDISVSLNAESRKKVIFLAVKSLRWGGGKAREKKSEKKDEH